MEKYCQEPPCPPRLHLHTWRTDGFLLALESLVPWAKLGPPWTKTSPPYHQGQPPQRVFEDQPVAQLGPVVPRMRREVEATSQGVFVDVEDITE